MKNPPANYTHPARRSKNTVHGSLHNDNFGSSISLSSTNNNGDRIRIADWILIVYSLICQYDHSLLGSNVTLSALC